MKVGSDGIWIHPGEIVKPSLTMETLPGTLKEAVKEALLKKNYHWTYGPCQLPSSV